MSSTPGRPLVRRTRRRQFLSACAAGHHRVRSADRQRGRRRRPHRPAPPAQPCRPSAGSGAYTVTLITGDVVHVTDLGGGKFRHRRAAPSWGAGRSPGETVGHDLYVIPDEALPYLAADALDRRLFDVTALIAAGYDDQRSDGIPLIVGYGKGPAPMSASAEPPAPTGTTRVRWAADWATSVAWALGTAELGDSSPAVRPVPTRSPLIWGQDPATVGELLAALAGRGLVVARAGTDPGTAVLRIRRAPPAIALGALFAPATRRTPCGRTRSGRPDRGVPARLPGPTRPAT